MRLRLFLLLLPLLGIALPALAQTDPSFMLVNRSGQAITEIYVSPVTDRNWGHNRLAGDQLVDGRAFPVRIPPAAGCRQDIRVVYADGRPEERRGIDTCPIEQVVFGTTSAPPTTRGLPQGGGNVGAGATAAAGNPSFNLVNQGRQPIREVYVSSARDTHWGEDRLGADTLAPGRWLAVRLPLNDCMNDIRVVWQDGRREDRRQVDTCRVVNLVFQ